MAGRPDWMSLNGPKVGSRILKSCPKHTHVYIDRILVALIPSFCFMSAPPQNRDGFRANLLFFSDVLQSVLKNHRKKQQFCPPERSPN